MRFFCVLVLGCLVIGFVPAYPIAQGKKAGKSVEQLAEDAKDAIVVILSSGRDGKQQGLGTGFVIGEDGLIATNLHVIGEARPIVVQLADGSKHDATVVEASDRKFDLAIIRIATRKKLKTLALGNATLLKQGQALVALGHPRGLEYSVVAGVLSGKRDFDGVSMLQLAIPIEQGNSGGPVLDMQGRVVGIVTMKSLVTANLGFAVPVNALKQIHDRPNPVTMDQWLTIGALDKNEWQTMYGARWRQRAGRILADGAGTGFGGRTICFSQRKPPELPYELTVTVKLEEERGAAGLIFGGDGGDKHYGFYPTSGKMRLTRFEGPDVYSPWRILHDEPTPHYRPGDWNTLRVRVEKDRISCFVNDERVAELKNPKYFGAAYGLTRFRDPSAEFKKFQIGAKVATSAIAAKDRAAFEKALPLISLDKETSAKDLAPLLKTPGDSMALLRDKAKALEQQAELMRKLALSVHHQRTLTELAELFKAPDDRVDLARAALLVARIDNEELDVDAYLQEIDRLARKVADRLPAKAKPEAALEALNQFLFKERGFHGSHSEYYTRSNSYLNEVIDDREGLPISLSVLYLEVARRLKLNVVGLALPAHFVVRHDPPGGKSQIVDVFEGKAITREAAIERVKKLTDMPPVEDDFKPVAKKTIVIRMLHNLINVAEAEKDREGRLRYLDGVVAVDANAHEEPAIPERW